MSDIARTGSSDNIPVIFQSALGVNITTTSGLLDNSVVLVVQGDQLGAALTSSITAMSRVGIVGRDRVIRDFHAEVVEVVDSSQWKLGIIILLEVLVNCWCRTWPGM